LGGSRPIRPYNEGTCSTPRQENRLITDKIRIASRMDALGIVLSLAAVAATDNSWPIAMVSKELR
jgi:hypothetical protein